MSLHESQSLLYGDAGLPPRARSSARSRRARARDLRRQRPGLGTRDNIHRLYTRREARFHPRRRADEVTSSGARDSALPPERDLIAGDMKLDDLPAARERRHEGVAWHRAALDREGCLQDIHWYDGASGLLPDSYAGRHDRRPASSTPPAAPGRRFRGYRQGRLRAAAGLATRERARPRLPPPTATSLTRATGRPLDPAVSSGT